MTVGTGSYRSTRYKRQSALGVYSNSGGQEMRRTGGAMSLDRPKVDNPQIRPDKQKAMPRQGLGMVNFPHEDVLAPGAYAPFYESLLLSAYGTAATSGALTTLTAAVTTAPAGTITRATGSFIIDGFHVGKVVRMTGWTTTATANNAHNFTITTLTPTVMTLNPVDGVALVAKAAGDSVTILEQGKSVKVPVTGHVSHYYSFEDWHPDLGQSEFAPDVRLESLGLKFSPNSNVTMSMAFKGLGTFITNNSAYFGSPTAAPTTDICSVATGIIMLGGVKLATITTADLSISCNLDMPATVCTPAYAFAADTVVSVDGSLTILWEDQTYMNAYQNETDLTFSIICANSRAANADFVGFTLGRCRLFSATKSTDEKSLTKTYNLQGAENTANATGTVASTISIQDSLAP